MDRHRLPRRNRCRPTVLCLEDRVLPSITIVEVPDLANPGFIQLRITGNDAAQSLTITDNQGGLNQIGIDATATPLLQRIFVRNPNGTLIYTVLTSNATGLTSTTALFANVDALTINLNGGNDEVTYNLTGFNTGAQTRTVSVNMGAGNDTFTVNSSQEIKDANLTINYLGGTGNDVANYTFAGIDNSHVTLTGDAGFGNDSVTMTFTGQPASINQTQVVALTNGSVVIDAMSLGAGGDTATVNVNGDIILGSSLSNSFNLGGGLNFFSYTEGVGTHGSILNNSQVSLNIQGGANADNVAVALNDTHIDTGQFSLTSDLGFGNDVFNGSYGPGFEITGTGGQATMNVGGGFGNDTINLTQTAANATIAGLFDINLHGDAGNDLINVVTNGDPAAGAMELDSTGNYSLHIDGGDGSDTIGVNLSNTAASTGNYDIAVLGGNAPDTVGFSIKTNGAAVTFEGGAILLDGGLPIPAPGQINNTLNLINPDNVTVTKVNFP